MGFKTAEDIIKGIKEHNWIALSKAITIIENGTDFNKKQQILNYAYKNSREDSFILGITGSGGAGKSTLIDGLINYFAKKNKRVGVIAVDPSSSFSGGAVLGDRIRMTGKKMNKDLFIRSFASRGNLGGISQAAKEALYLYKFFGFDVIIVESYGVGQAETDIRDFVDVSAVVMVPGNGDYIQLAKAGIQEIADVFVINKADNKEADLLYSSLLSVIEIIPQEERPQIIKTIARDGKGINELGDILLETFYKVSVKIEEKRKRRILNEIITNAYRIFEPDLYEEANNILIKVLEGKLTPFDAAQILGKRIYLR